MKRAPSFSSSAPGNGRPRNKRPGAGQRRRQRRRQNEAGKLQKMGQAVREFVESAAGSEGPFPSLSGTPNGAAPAAHRRRNRREVRREKRKLKRSLRRRRRALNGEEAAGAPPPRPPHQGASAAAAAAPGREKKPKPPPEEKKAAKEKRPPEAPEEEKNKEPKPRPGARPSTAPSAPSVGRKRALLAANEAEEREIRRLERQLGLRKRRRKARPGWEEEDDDDDMAAALPPSFARDGLGYVLGALGSGATFLGLDGSSEEEEEGARGEPGDGLNLTDEGGDTDGQEDDDGEEEEEGAAEGPSLTNEGNDTDGQEDDGEELEEEEEEGAGGEPGDGLSLTDEGGDGQEDDGEEEEEEEGAGEGLSLTNEGDGTDGQEDDGEEELQEEEGAAEGLTLTDEGDGTDGQEDDGEEELEEEEGAGEGLSLTDEGDGTDGQEDDGEEELEEEEGAGEGLSLTDEGDGTDGQEDDGEEELEEEEGAGEGLSLTDEGDGTDGQEDDGEEELEEEEGAGEGVSLTDEGDGTDGQEDDGEEELEEEEGAGEGLSLTGGGDGTNGQEDDGEEELEEEEGAGEGLSLTDEGDGTDGQEDNGEEELEEEEGAGEGLSLTDEGDGTDGQEDDGEEELEEEEGAGEGLSLTDEGDGTDGQEDGGEEESEEEDGGGEGLSLTDEGDGSDGQEDDGEEELEEEEGDRGEPGEGLSLTGENTTDGQEEDGEEELEEEGAGEGLSLTDEGSDTDGQEEDGEEELEEEGDGGEPGEGLTLTNEGGNTNGQEDDGEEELEEEEDSALGEEEGDESSMEGEGGSEEEEAYHSIRNSEDEAQTEKLPSQTAAKYLPHLRRPEEMLDSKRREELERLKKTVKGLVNRLSEPNLASISGQLEELYMAHSRKDMNETLTNTVISACVTSSAMPSRLVMEHVLLISVLYQRVGIEVGAHFLETAVRKFDEVYKSETEGKECENLLTLIAHLYNFHVVHSLLIFDILKKLVSTFSEKDIELILLLLKNVGFSLRKDDALALKELITEVQKKANAVGKQFQDQSRVRFMLEIMLALKNNDMRKIPGYDPEPAEKLRKLLRTLVHGGNSGKEAQLRVSLESLLSADQVGRWWIVGSSWSGAPMIDSTSNKIQQVLPAGKVSSKILELARKQRMNTDIRRNIFCILMTSEDFLDAFEKLLKLRLKDQQEREIVHVLVDCCLQEKTYNPFYAHLSAKFCEYERRFQMTFQFTMWDKIKDLGNLSAAASSNLIHLLAHLLKTKSLSLTVFKVIEFSELDKPKALFLRQVLSVLLLQTDPEELSHIFGKLADNPKLGMLYESLKLFLTHFVLKNIKPLPNVEMVTLLKEKTELVIRVLKAKESRLKL